MNKRIILITLGILLLPSLLVKTANAAFNISEIPVNVSVEGVTEIEINPYSLTWTDVAPGTEGGVLEIDVKNIGSTNVTGFYGYVDTLTDETTNPIGSSNSQDYASGGVLTFRRNESGAEHYFAGRVEWNNTNRIELITLPTDAVSWGWFRNASVEYVWGLANGTSAEDNHWCNESGASLIVNKYDDNGTSMTRNVDGGTYSDDGGTVSTGVDWGIFDGFSAGPWQNYCVAAYYNCTKLYVYKYDRNFDSTATCADLGFLNTTMWRGPSEIQTINLNVWMPYGVPAGDMLQATLTIYATE